MEFYFHLSNPDMQGDDADMPALLPPQVQIDEDYDADMPALMPIPDDEDYSDMPALQEPDDQEDYSDMPELLPPPTKWIHPYIFHQYRSLFTPIDDLPPLISDSSEDESSDASGDSGDYAGSGEE